MFLLLRFSLLATLMKYQLEKALAQITSLASGARVEVANLLTIERDLMRQIHGLCLNRADRIC